MNTRIKLTMALTLAAVALMSVVAVATPQQIFAQGDVRSETETEVNAKNKCNVSGFSTCDQSAAASLTVVPAP